jgi:hypothetical protein
MQTDDLAAKNDAFHISVNVERIVDFFDKAQLLRRNLVRRFAEAAHLIGASD